MSFWWWAAAFLVCAVGFVAYPFLRVAKSRPEPDRTATVRALYHDRLAELDGEVAAGQLAAESRDSVAAEIGAALLADYPLEPSVARSGASSVADVPNPGVALVAALVLVLVGLGTYWQVGEPGAHQIVGAEAVLRLDPRTDIEALQGWRAKLKSRVADKPGDAQSWYLLGHCELQLQGFQRAAEAFGMAHRIVGDDPSIDVYWLQARYLAAKGDIDSMTRDIAERLLKSRPNHPLVLEMFAIDAYRRGEFRGAVESLNQALSGSLSASQRVTLNTSLAQARAQLGDLVPSIDLRIRTQTPLPPGATLFVIARPSGGGMPYAVVRRSNAVLPLSVRLDDAVAMNAARPLSAASRIQVVVRVSLSGAAMAQPGDWEWQSEAISVEALQVPMVFDVELAPPAENS